MNPFDRGRSLLAARALPPARVWSRGRVAGVSVGADCVRFPAGDHGTTLSTDFFRMLWTKAEEWKSKGMTAGPEVFLNVWTNESGIRSDTSACNPPSYNAGLNGMGEQERQNTGFSDGHDAWVSLTPEEQLPYVLRFYELNVPSFLGWPNVDRAGTLYLLNFLPAYVGHHDDPSFVLADSQNDVHGWYKANPSLDIGQKGYIEVADMDRAMAAAAQRSRYKDAVARLYAEGPSGGPLPIPPPGSYVPGGGGGSWLTRSRVQTGLGWAAAIGASAGIYVLARRGKLDPLVSKATSAMNPLLRRAKALVT